MKAPDGTIISQFDLHDLEKVSLIKYDLLSVEAMDKIQICLDLLVENGYIKQYPTLKETYEHAIGIYTIERNDINMWKMLWDHKIQSCFQMEQASGIQGIALTHPKSVDDLATLNSVIRLMAQDENSEQPLHKYARFKKDISLWYKEMDDYGLTKQEQKVLEPILKISYGICESQERFMSLVQLPECGGFDLQFADKLRKSVAKKKPKEFQELENEYFQVVKEKGLSKKLCDYVWNVCVSTSKGYGFNLSHTLAYSLIALQEMNLAYKYPIIFWNCANLIVDSGTAEGVEGKTADYDKIAKAVNKIKSEGINVSSIDINNSELAFKPNAKNNIIYYGLGGLQGVGNDVAQKIIDNRPYKSMEDFIKKVNPNKTVMTALIKSGAFDEFDSRKNIMAAYIWQVCEPKKRVTMQNFKMLAEYNLIPDNFKFQRQTFNFNKGLKKDCKYKNYFILDKINKYYRFYINHFSDDYIETIDNHIVIKQTNWKKQYDDVMSAVKDYIKSNNKELLNKLNNNIFNEMYNKYGEGSELHWEMTSLGTYSNGHELKAVNPAFYDIVKYEDLPREPEVTGHYNFKGIEREVYKISTIMGTVIAKDEGHSTISILTTDGTVVNVKMAKSYFSRYNKRISEIMPDGTKKLRENGFFQRGTLLVINGFRRGDNFFSRSTKTTHQLYKITKICDNGMVQMTNERWDEREGN